MGTNYHNDLSEDNDSLAKANRVPSNEEDDRNGPRPSTDESDYSILCKYGLHDPNWEQQAYYNRVSAISGTG